MIQGRFISNKRICVLLAFFLMGAHAHGAEPPAVAGEFLVQLKNGFKPQGNAAFAALGSDTRVQVVSSKANLLKVTTNPLLRSDFVLEALRSDPSVEIAEPNFIYRIVKTPNDPQLGELWGLINSGQKNGRVGVDIGAAAAWNISTGSDQVVVAVIDTGIDYTHQDLAANVWVNEIERDGEPGVDDDGNGYVDDIYGYDFVNNDGDPMDDHGHGSHCAGTIGARGDDGLGIVGVAWNVKLMGLKFLSRSGSGTLDAAVKAIEYATEKNVDIMSNSWGGGGYSQILYNAIEAARQKGILFVAAAGNESQNNDTFPAYPASYKIDNVISVAAVDRFGQLANFSNRGKNSVHIAAPGVEIHSSIPGGYATWNGTSMATPHVSGVATLLKAHEPHLTYSEIRDRLMRTSRPLAALRNATISGGVVNAYYALTDQLAPIDSEDPFHWTSQEEVFSTPHPYPSNSDLTHTVHVPGAKKLAVYFSRFETETGFDTVKFKDANGNVIATWSGNRSDAYSPVVVGDTLIIEFRSDASVNKYGFDIERVAYQ